MSAPTGQCREFGRSETDRPRRQRPACAGDDRPRQPRAPPSVAPARADRARVSRPPGHCDRAHAHRQTGAASGCGDLGDRSHTRRGGGAARRPVVQLCRRRSDGLRTVAALAGGADAFVVEFGTLADAVDAILHTLDATAPRAPTRIETSPPAPAAFDVEMLAGEALVWNRATGELHRLSPSATAIWRASGACVRPAHDCSNARGRNAARTRGRRALHRPAHRDRPRRRAVGRRPAGSAPGVRALTALGRPVGSSATALARAG